MRTSVKCAHITNVCTAFPLKLPTQHTITLQLIHMNTRVRMYAYDNVVYNTCLQYANILTSAYKTMGQYHHFTHNKRECMYAYALYFVDTCVRTYLYTFLASTKQPTVQNTIVHTVMVQVIACDKHI